MTSIERRKDLLGRASADDACAGFTLALCSTTDLCTSNRHRVVQPSAMLLAIFKCACALHTPARERNRNRCKLSVATRSYASCVCDRDCLATKSTHVAATLRLHPCCMHCGVAICSLTGTDSSQPVPTRPCQVNAMLQTCASRPVVRRCCRFLCKAW